MNEELLTPKLRFPMFEDEYNKVQIQELIDNKFIISHLDGNHGELYPRSYEFTNSGVPYISANDFIMGHVNTNSCKFLSEERASTFKKGIAINGDILFAHNATVGPTALLETDKPYVILSTTATYYRCDNNKLLNRYLKAYFESNFFIRQYSRVMSQSTRNQVPITTQRKFYVSIPSLQEQQKIASFLSAVDKRIQLLEKKKEQLEQYKKGVMQKLFSQEIRFKPDLSEVEGGEDGNNYPDWEEKKLKEIISNFIVPMRDKPKKLNGEIPWCRIEDFDGKYLTTSKSNQGVSYTTVKEMNLKIYPLNTLLVSCSANLGFCAIVKKELITNQTFIGLVPIETKIDVEFLFYTMKLSSRKLNSLSSGTTISYLSREEFERFKIKIPCLKEQRKIANFLCRIDKKIEHTNKQIDKSKEFKKGLLQQMFV